MLCTTFCYAHGKGLEKALWVDCSSNHWSLHLQECASAVVCVMLHYALLLVKYIMLRQLAVSIWGLESLAA